MQNSGLGILGNLILIKGSYSFLCNKIPQFLDMAFSFILDFDHQQTKRKEAMLIVSNFIVAFFQGKETF